MKIFIPLFLLNLFFLGLHAQEDELFQQVFKKSSEQTVSLPLFFDSSFQGEGFFKVANSQRIISVQKEFILKALKGVISEESLKKISSRSQQYIPMTLFSELKMTFTFKPERLIAELNIPSSIRASKDVDLAFNRIPRWANNAKRSEGLSGFVNFFNFYRNDSLLSEDSLTSDQNWNFNYGRFALFGQTSYQNDSESRFIRQDVRLTYDQPQNLLRYQFGDLNYQVLDYQTFQPGAGVMVTTNFDLNPYRLFNPMGFREITLNAPSRVRIFINGILVQTLNLPVGRHRLDNLPLNEGINTIRLEIQDNRGRNEEINFKGTTSFALIGKGLHEMTYGGGIPAENALQDRRYDTSDKKYFYVLNHLYGHSNNSNIGYGLMGNANQRLLSLRNLYQGRFGVSNLNLSFSQLMKPLSGNDGEAVGGRFTHVFRDYQSEERRLRTLDLGVEFLGPGFVPMDDRTADENARVSPELGYTQFITDAVNVRLRGLYRFNSKNTSSNFYNISSALTLLYQRFYQFGLQFSHSGFKDGASDSQVLLSFNWAMPEQGHVVTTSYNTSNKELNGQWNYTGRGRPSNLRGLVNYRQNETNENYEAEFGKQDQRYEANINFLQREGIGNSSSSLLTGSFNTSLAFAGGEVSLSRPINQGFALVKANEALEEANLFLNRNGKEYEAETGWLSSAVLPNYQAYRYYPIRVDSREVPFGIKVPPQEVVVEAPFRGGVLVPFTSKYSKALVGKILYNGNALSLKTGRLVNKVENKEYPFFTNRKGRFLVESIPPGEYEVLIEEKTLSTLKIKKDGNAIQRWEYNK
jgi:outer membrane usher protein